MSDTRRSEAQVAFIAAGVVLLALPLLASFGLAAIALVTEAGATGQAKWLLWALFAMWVAVVVIASIVFAVRFIRKARSA